PDPTAAAILARFHLAWWRTTGVQPRGAQVRRISGSSDMPRFVPEHDDGPALAGVLPDAGPVAGDPALDRGLVAFPRAAGAGRCSRSPRRSRRLLQTGPGR